MSKMFENELEAAHILAHDTLRVLATSGDAMTRPQTYLERILANVNDIGVINSIMMEVAGGSTGYKSIIPEGYGYRLEYLDVDSQAAGSENWVKLYDAGTDGCNFGSDRCGKNFTKLQASETTFLAGYEVPAAPGQSPFCYLGCQGYVSTNTYLPVCNSTPCEPFTSNFYAGSNSMRIVRLIVYT